MKQPLDEQDLQQDDVCNKLPTQKVKPGFVGQTRKAARLSHSSRRLLLGDQTTPLLDSCIVFGILSSILTKDPKWKRLITHWQLNSDYIKAQVPSKLLTRSLRRLRTGWLLVSAQLIIRSDYFKISNKVVTKRDSAEKACCILFSPNSHSFVARSWKGRSIEPGF